MVLLQPKASTEKDVPRKIAKTRCSDAALMVKLPLKETMRKDAQNLQQRSRLPQLQQLSLNPNPSLIQKQRQRNKFQAKRQPNRSSKVASPPNMDAALTTKLQLPDPTSQVVHLAFPAALDAVLITTLPLMDRIEKAAASCHHSDVVQTTFRKLEDQISKDVAVNTRHTAVVLIAKLQLRVTTTKVVDANTHLTDVVQMKLHRQLVKATQVVHATHINSVAVLTESQYPPDLTTKAVIAVAVNSNAVPTISLRPRAPTSRDALVLQANMAVAPMVPLRLRDPTLKSVRRRFQTLLKRLAVSNVIWEHAATTTQSSTSSIPSMAVAVASGMVDVEETKTDSTLKMTAKRLALSQLAKTFVICPKSMDLAPVTTQCGITTATGTLARNSSMEVALEMPIDSRNSRIARLNVWLTTRSVSKFLVLVVLVFI
jgi:hypothetical protein